ncbi:hypothetical protein [Actinomadura sp. 3N407]|uniref:hypothetical protein n=1 Tax=Actinomadura sp. 3N407 TaxID=3457423 RepID=UPI003FCCFD1D
MSSENYGFTPLHEAAENGHAEVTRALLAAGAHVGDRLACDGRPAASLVALGSAALVADGRTPVPTASPRWRCWAAPPARPSATPAAGDLNLETALLPAQGRTRHRQVRTRRRPRARLPYPFR